jgi:hypothetical protein
MKQCDEIRRIMRAGYKYAHRQHLDGEFDRFDSSKVRLETSQSTRRRVPSPARSVAPSVQALHPLGDLGCEALLQLA